MAVDLQDLPLVALALVVGDPAWVRNTPYIYCTPRQEVDTKPAKSQANKQIPLTSPANEQTPSKSREKHYRFLLFLDLHLFHHSDP